MRSGRRPASLGEPGRWLPGGRKVEFAEFADDKADGITALNEARRLVQQEDVFAIVPTLSPNLGQGEFFDQQHVPYFGWDSRSRTATPATASR